MGRKLDKHTSDRLFSSLFKNQTKILTFKLHHIVLDERRISGKFHSSKRTCRYVVVIYLIIKEKGWQTIFKNNINTH